MRTLSSNRGSVLIVALMFAAILAIGLTSYMNLSLGSARLANRSFYMNAAQNLADTGIERTIWSLNDERNHAAPDNWTTYGGFTARAGYTNEYQGTFPSNSTYYTFSGGVQGQVKVWSAYDSTTKLWHTVSKGIITLADGTTLSKVAESYLQQRSWSDNGMVARNGISFNGNNVKVDSWRSRYPTDTSDVPYSSTVARSEATVACLSFVSLQTADVYGYAYIGTSTIASGLTWQQNNGTLNSLGNTGVDTSRVTLDFTGSYPDVDLPASVPGSLGALAGSTTLSTGSYHYSSITLNSGAGGGDTITVGPSTVDATHPAATVTIVVDNDISMSGQGQITINPGSSLTLYVGGNFTMTGNNASLQNGSTGSPSNPDRCTILGTRTGSQTAQTWDLGGGSGTYLSCVIYSPNCNLTVHGSGAIYGSLVANTVTMSGQGDFHQDESLKSNRKTGIWGMLKWRELSTESDRNTYAVQLAF